MEGARIAAVGSLARPSRITALTLFSLCPSGGLDSRKRAVDGYSFPSYTLLENITLMATDDHLL